MPASSQSLRFILSLRMNSSFITSRPGPMTHVRGCLGSAFGPCFVMQYVGAFLVLQSSHRGKTIFVLLLLGGY